METSHKKCQLRFQVVEKQLQSFYPGCQSENKLMCLKLAVEKVSI